eukprot:TRINITY_DN5175_c0_g1_i1.p1 TRINITY_DN5175_c0_g1~~TRINITY_DN5175_c0_g1_i1.p1  ORF type:complete len:163 (+),score=30.87 TRINITY_DN5175_c0_g1_i1:92-580(+)
MSSRPLLFNTTPFSAPSINPQIETKGKAIILFDGVCCLCNNFVNFVIDNDPKKVFLFAPLQSQLGGVLLTQFSLPHDLSTVVLIKDECSYTKSSAALSVLSSLRMPYPLLYGFIIVPKFIRDFVYDLVAKSRYSVFGKEEVCRRPTRELQQRFLDQVNEDMV